jgi:peptidoglycan/LPS O-acetylase OafA/YrhL
MMHSRNFGLDVVRTTAILPVLAVHYLAFTAPKAPALVWQGGILGVTIFFVLSGFLIGRIMLRQFDGDAGWPEVMTFYRRRWLRTLPLYYVAFATALFVSPAGIRLAAEIDWRTILYLPFLQNFAWPIPNWFSESWSLAVEEWFYLLFPLGILALRRVPILTRVAMLATIMALLPAVLRSVSHLVDIAPTQNIVVLRLDAIAFGVLAACLDRTCPDFIRRCRWLLGAAGLAGMAAAYWSSVQATPWLPPVVQPSLMGASIAAVILSFNALNWDRIASGPVGALINWTSTRSYALYLCHGVVVRLMLYKGTFDKPALLSLTVYIAFCAILSELAHRTIERPFMAMRPPENRVPQTDNGAVRAAA